MLRFAIVTLLLTSLTSPGLALVDGQLLLGKRQADLDLDGSSDSVDATEYELALHVDPIPFVPLALGVYYLGQDYDVSTSSNTFAQESFEGVQFGLEIMAWAPVDFFDITPYVKVGYSLWGLYEASNASVAVQSTSGDATTAKVESEYDAKGLHIGIGLRWSPIAIVSGLLEFDYGRETYTLSELTVDGTQVDKGSLGDTTLEATSYAIRLGVEAGF